MGVKNLPDCVGSLERKRAPDPSTSRHEKAAKHMSKARFIKSVVTSAQKDIPQMPWTRGTRRAAFIIKRDTPTTLRKSA